MKAPIAQSGEQDCAIGAFIGLYGQTYSALLSASMIKNVI
jgi:hypothetical protein